MEESGRNWEIFGDLRNGEDGIQNWGENTGLHWKDELITESFGWGINKTTEEFI